MCADNILKCTGYEFSFDDSICKTFNEIIDLEGDNANGAECTIK